MPGEIRECKICSGTMVLESFTTDNGVVEKMICTNCQHGEEERIIDEHISN